MRIFVTGASGYIGGAVVRELLAHGHHVSGLARSDAAAQRVREFGATVVHGGLDSLDVLERTARARCHRARGSSRATGVADTERAAPGAAEGRAVRSCHRVYQRCLGVWGPWRRVVDEDAARAVAVAAWRPAHEQRARVCGCRRVADRHSAHGRVLRRWRPNREHAQNGARRSGAHCRRRSQSLVVVRVMRWPNSTGALLENPAGHGSITRRARCAGALREIARAVARAAGGDERRAPPTLAPRAEFGAYAEALTLDLQVSSASDARAGLGTASADHPEELANTVVP